jgi:hypothetical protein
MVVPMFIMLIAVLSLGCRAALSRPAQTRHDKIRHRGDPRRRNQHHH